MVKSELCILWSECTLNASHSTLQGYPIDVEKDIKAVQHYSTVFNKKIQMY